MRAEISRCPRRKIQFYLVSRLDDGSDTRALDGRQAKVDQRSQIDIRNRLRDNCRNSSVAERSWRVFRARAHPKINTGDDNVAGADLFMKIRIQPGHHSFDVPRIDAVAELPRFAFEILFH